MAQWCKFMATWKGAFKQSKNGCIKIRLSTDGSCGEWRRELWDEVAAEVPRGSMGFHKCTTHGLYILDMSTVAPAVQRLA